MKEQEDFFSSAKKLRVPFFMWNLKRNVNSKKKCKE